MHSLAILTALTATSGLWGHGGCNTGGCGRPLMSWCAPRAACARPCNTYMVTGHWRGYVGACGTCPTAAAAAPAPAPAPAPQAAPAAPVPPPPPAAAQVYPAAPRVARAAYYYPSFYSYPATQTCPGGNCPRR
jgi:hypothetical protein